MGQSSSHVRKPSAPAVAVRCAGARASVAVAGREWGGAVGAVLERTGELQGLLRDHGQGGAPASELRRLLASGALSPPLHQWLTASLGEGGLRV